MSVYYVGNRNLGFRVVTNIFEAEDLAKSLSVTYRVSISVSTVSEPLFVVYP